MGSKGSRRPRIGQHLSQSPLTRKRSKPSHTSRGAAQQQNIQPRAVDPSLGCICTVRMNKRTGRETESILILSDSCYRAQSEGNDWCDAHAGQTCNHGPLLCEKHLKESKQQFLPEREEASFWWEREWSEQRCGNSFHPKILLLCL